MPPTTSSLSGITGIAMISLSSSLFGMAGIAVIFSTSSFLLLGHWTWETTTMSLDRLPVYCETLVDEVPRSFRSLGDRIST
jgi:hypothetical protein